jgi:hypothetical protein
MQHYDTDVLILKPKAALLGFLAEQLPDVDLSGIRLKKTNHTAYTIIKRETDEDTLDEIERNFPAMFRHEIGRLLGANAFNGIECSFLDFLCCFKFELHSQIILMESSIDKGQQILCVKPRSVVLNWIKTSLAEDKTDVGSVFERVNLSHLTENATVLVKNFKHLSEIPAFIKHYYRPIYKAEMMRMGANAASWPVVDSFQLFRRYFSVEIHTQLVHLHATSLPTASISVA